jgi:hypothetical protein
MNPPTAKLDTPMPGAGDDASIPMLTERLTLPPLELDTTLPHDLGEDPPAAPPAQAPLSRPLPAVSVPLPLSLPAVPLPVPPAAAPLPVTPAAAAMQMPAEPAPVDAASAGAHWTRIELDLRASILNELAQALPQEVDAIVRSRMDDAIERLVGQLAAETRLAVAASLRDIVEHAVRAELDRLRGRKR